MHEGEHLFAHERIVVSPAAGLFSPADGLREGADLAAGHVLGEVAGQEVRSPFAGSVVGVLAEPGERVTVSQPLAWLRVSS